MRRWLLYFSLLGAALATCATPALADRDQVQFGSNIRVGQNGSIHDAVCFFCNVDVEGTVEGDIVVFFGNVRIKGHSNHDVVDFFGGVTLGDEAGIGEDLVSMFGHVRLGENASVGRDMVAMFGSVTAPDSVAISGSRVTQPPWMFWGPLLVFIGIVWLLVHEFRNYRRRAYVRNYPYPPPPRP